MRLERKGRGGKAVTVLSGLPGPTAALADLARDLKTACGAGGTLKGSEIEIQGDQRDRLEAYLSERGFSVKRSGG
jgi:translation initiation factor 1